MKIISIELIRRGRIDNYYKVTVDTWENTPDNKQEVYNACDRGNFGGFIESVSRTPDGYVLMVDVYTD